MKQTCIAIAAVACITIILYGCGQKKSGELSVIDTLAGKAQIEAYKKAKSTIRGVDNSRREQYGETK
jgi:hypothetical protein